MDATFIQLFLAGMLLITMLCSTPTFSTVNLLCKIFDNKCYNLFVY